jgi:hypothetical protein
MNGSSEENDPDDREGIEVHGEIVKGEDSPGGRDYQSI